MISEENKKRIEEHCIHGRDMVEEYGLSLNSIKAAKRTAWGSMTEMQVFAIGIEHGYQLATKEKDADTERLEWMAEKGLGVARNTMATINDHWFVFNHRGESQVYRNTFREAIDWAMENIR